MAQRDHEFWAGNKGGCYPKEVLIGELPVTAEVEVLKAYLIQVSLLVWLLDWRWNPEDKLITLGLNAPQQVFPT